METVCRTGYSALLQTCKLWNIPFTPPPNSTLNQKFNVAASEVLAVNEVPSLSYVAIGNKGSTYEIGQGGYVLTDPVPHLPRHAAAYNFIPFIARPVDSDLSAGERSRYRIRVLQTIGGVQYALYYLRVIDKSSLVAELVLRNVNNGVITDTPFVPSVSDLSPEHPVLSNPDLNTPNGDYLVVQSKTNFILNHAEITDIREACQILYGDPRYAVINEIMLCTGVDKVVTGQFGSTTSNYTEAVCAQVTSFIHQHHALTESSTEVNIGLNAGSVEPLLV